MRLHTYALARALSRRQKQTFPAMGNDRISLFEETRPVIKSRRYPLSTERRYRREVAENQSEVL